MMEPKDFCPMLIDILSRCGVAIVFLPHIGGSFLHGATFYDDNKIVLGLTVRGKDADKFWFSMFHELGHIILGHIGKIEGLKDSDENVADEFAKNELIPTNIFDEFAKNVELTRENIIEFAKQLGIDAGIVVGRLQKEGYIRFSWYNDLKTKYTISA